MSVINYTVWRKAKANTTTHVDVAALRLFPAIPYNAIAGARGR
jgi:hypothetical protein